MSTLKQHGFWSGRSSNALACWNATYIRISTIQHTVDKPWFNPLTFLSILQLTHAVGDFNLKSTRIPSSSLNFEGAKYNWNIKICGVSHPGLWNCKPFDPSNPSWWCKGCCCQPQLSRQIAQRRMRRRWAKHHGTPRQGHLPGWCWSKAGLKIMCLQVKMDWAMNWKSTKWKDSASVSFIHFK